MQYQARHYIMVLETEVILRFQGAFLTQMYFSLLFVSLFSR